MRPLDYITDGERFRSTVNVTVPPKGVVVLKVELEE